MDLGGWDNLSGGYLSSLRSSSHFNLSCEAKSENASLASKLLYAYWIILTPTKQLSRHLVVLRSIYAKERQCLTLKLS